MNLELSIVLSNVVGIAVGMFAGWMVFAPGQKPIDPFDGVPKPPACPNCRHKNHSIRQSPDGIAYCLECGTRVWPPVSADDAKPGCRVEVDASKLAVNVEDLIGDNFGFPYEECSISVRCECGIQRSADGVAVADPPSSDSAGVLV